jgi:3-oxoacyl-[acyl-carrier-protein] synthase-3
MRAAITGIGASVPTKVLTNQDFEKFLDTSDEWITQRTGIKTRHIVTDGQTTASLGAAAARQALDDAGVDPKDLDLILCATITPDMLCPSTACFIQQQIGATDVASLDVGAACSGYVYAMAIASKFIETGTYRKILIVGAEALSRFADYTDRTSCILFGDGAGAAVLGPTDDPDKGVQYTVLHADGAGWDFIHVPAGGTREPASHASVDGHRHYLKMRGRDVYKFAVEKMQWVLADCMEHCGLGPDDVDLVVPHQVNIRILRSAAEKLGFPMDKVYVNIDRYGNTSAASIPLAMEEARRRGRIGPGSTLVLAAFGAGLTWAGAVVRL